MNKTRICLVCGAEFQADSRTNTCSIHCGLILRNGIDFRETPEHKEKMKRLAKRDAEYAKAFPGLGPHEQKMRPMSAAKELANIYIRKFCG